MHSTHSRLDSTTVLPAAPKEEENNFIFSLEQVAQVL